MFFPEFISPPPISIDISIKMSSIDYWRRTCCVCYRLVEVRPLRYFSPSQFLAPAFCQHDQVPRERLHLCRSLRTFAFWFCIISGWEILLK